MLGEGDKLGDADGDKLGERLVEELGLSEGESEGDILDDSAIPYLPTPSKLRKPPVANDCSSPTAMLGSVAA